MASVTVPPLGSDPAQEDNSPENDASVLDRVHHLLQDRAILWTLLILGLAACASVVLIVAFGGSIVLTSLLALAGVTTGGTYVAGRRKRDV